MAVLGKAEITISDILDGKGIKSTAISYQAGTSGTTTPTGTWSSTVPSVPQGQYLWSRTVITYSDNTTSTTYSVAYIPKNGAAGSTGATGTGVEKITQQYYLSTSKTSQTGGSWATSMPTWSSGKYLWTRYQITYKNPTSTAYTSPICDSSWEAVNEVKVGGRNLFKHSGDLSAPWNRPDTQIFPYELDNKYNQFEIYDSSTTYEISHNIQSENIDIVNKDITLSVMAKATADNQQLQTIFSTLMANTVIKNVQLKKNEWIKASWSFYNTYDLLTFRFVGCIGASPDTPIIIALPKLEYGNVATDWTPAPEDVDQSIGNAQDTADQALNNSDNANNRISVAEMTIDSINKSISTLVTDGNGGSLMTQGPDGWTFNIGDIQKNIQSASDQLNSLAGNMAEADQAITNLNSLATDLSKKTAYINMTTDESGDPCIELGKQGNEFRVRITNTSIDFLQGNSKVAYFNNHSLYIQKSIINDALQIGETMGFIWKRRGNGNMGLRWVGG